MEAKEPAKMESCLPRGSGPHEDFILEVFRFDFLKDFGVSGTFLGTLLGDIFGKFFVVSIGVLKAVESRE